MIGVDWIAIPISRSFGDWLRGRQASGERDGSICLTQGQLEMNGPCLADRKKWVGGRGPEVSQFGATDCRKKRWWWWWLGLGRRDRAAVSNWKKGGRDFNS